MNLLLPGRFDVITFKPYCHVCAAAFCRSRLETESSKLQPASRQASKASASTSDGSFASEYLCAGTAEREVCVCVCVCVCAVKREIFATD